LAKRLAKIVSVPWFKVTFMVEAESAEAFDSELDEGKIAAALPGRTAFLAMIEESPTVTESVRKAWRRLRRSE